MRGVELLTYDDLVGRAQQLISNIEAAVAPVLPPIPKEGRANQFSDFAKEE
jgi:hypothetical protein